MNEWMDDGLPKGNIVCDWKIVFLRCAYVSNSSSWKPTQPCLLSGRIVLLHKNSVKSQKHPVERRFLGRGGL